MRTKQSEEIKAAGLVGLEECPFCDFKAIIDEPGEPLFRCAHVDCGVVSCRICKKKVFFFPFSKKLFSFYVSGSLPDEL